MIKERRFSVKYDFQSGIISKISFFISVIFFLITLIEILLNITIFFEPSVYAALILLFLAITAISWFFHSQFAKLSRIATEIEKEECNHN